MPVLTNHNCRAPRCFTNTHFQYEKWPWKRIFFYLFFLSSFPVFLPIYRISLPASVLSFPLCVSTFIFCLFTFFFYIYFHPCLFPHECTLRAGVCIRYAPLPSSVYFPHARSHMGFNYEQMPGKCKARAHACTAEPCPTSSCECCYRLWICFLSCKLRKRNKPGRREKGTVF